MRRDWGVRSEVLALRLVTSSHGSRVTGRQDSRRGPPALAVPDNARTARGAGNTGEWSSRPAGAGAAAGPCLDTLAQPGEGCDTDAGDRPARQGRRAGRAGSGRRLRGLELLLLGRAGQRGGRGLAVLDGLRHRVEVAGADLALVLDRGEATLGGGELGLLQLDERAHLPARVAVGEVEHAVVEAVETGQGDELELVAQLGQLGLERRDGGVVEVLLPVEARRAVVGEQLAGELRMDSLGEGRFKSSLVNSERYLLTDYRYIELNPVRAALAEA